MKRLSPSPTLSDFVRQVPGIVDSWLHQVTLRFGVIRQETTPGTQEIPNNQWGIFKNTTTGDLTLSLNDDGVVKSTILTTGGGGGDVLGPASAIDNRVAFFDGTTGKRIKDSGLTLSGNNTGDQTSIVGITGTLAQFNAALTGADFATGGGTATGTNTGDQTSIVGITGTLAQFNAAMTDADFATGGGTATGTNTGNETATSIGTLINGATSKTTPVDADQLGLMDSAASNILKKLSWANIKTTLKTYFDTLYQPLSATLTSWASKTVPAGTVVGTTDSQTLSSKSLTSPTLTGTTTAATVVASTLELNAAGSATIPQIYLNGVSPNWIKWTSGGTNPPAFTTRSNGAKLVMVDLVDASNTDYAQGIESGAMWFGVPSNITSRGFKWYGGTTELMSIFGGGIGLNVNGPIITTGQVFQPVGTSTSVAGDTIALTKSHRYFLQKSTSTLATLTVTLPASPTDGEVHKFMSRGAITTLTVNAADATLVRGQPTSLAAEGFFEMLYVGAHAWVRSG